MTPWIPDEEYITLLERVADLETKKLMLKDLPYDDLIQKLSTESSFKGRDLLLKKSVGNDLLGNESVDSRALAIDAVGTEERTAVPAARVHRTTAQTIANNTWTSISHDVEEFDNGGMWVVGSPTLLTAKADGIHIVTANAQFSGAGGTFRAARLRVNGTDEVAIGVVGVSSDTMPLAVPVYLDAGDYVELQVFQNSGGNLNTAPSSPFLAAVWLSK
ncbi:hypothetical protein [Sinimarinibacterium flocculans]|uniref:hypothetical protein n=1 Tax=Sinimarinibacterium flocculans TaxID=985250 RepID=UPI00249142DC|nr:hypothetical protein [Sinimarinibacterium flocculans]